MRSLKRLTILVGLLEHAATAGLFTTMLAFLVADEPA
jgi:hypothetical protein